VDGILLRVALVNLQRADARGIIDGGVLEAAHLLFVLVVEVEELDIDLDVVARHLFLIPLREDGTLPGIAWQAVEAVAQQHGADAAGRDRDVVVALQVPSDAQRPEMISAAQMKDLLLGLLGRPELWVFGAGLAIDQAGLTLFSERSFPLIKGFSR